MKRETLKSIIKTIIRESMKESMHAHHSDPEYQGHVKSIHHSAKTGDKDKLSGHKDSLRKYLAAKKIDPNENPEDVEALGMQSMHETRYGTSMEDEFAAKQRAVANDEPESMEKKKTMTVLNLSQHSKAEAFMRVSYDWKTYTPKFRPFDEIADKFPEVVREVTPEQGPSWGSAFYIKGEDGMPIMYKEHWDTSG